MKVLDSPLSDFVQATYCLEVGNFHYFNDFLIAEINAGVMVTFEDVKDIFDLNLEFFGERPFGFISNRINSYSIDLVDLAKNSEQYLRSCAYAIVTYSDNSRRVLNIEDHYINFNRKRFNDLQTAIKWVMQKVKDTTSSLDKSHPL